MKARAYELFGEAIELPADARLDWLRGQCGDETELLNMVLRLLAAEDSAGVLDEQMAVLAEPLMRPDAADDADDPRLGKIYGPYTLLRVLGRGGMGTVYEARRSDGGFVQTVALKLPSRGLEDLRALRRFEQERQILVRLKHAHIAGFLDGGVSNDGQPWYALELINGLPLNRWAEQGKDLRTRLGCFVQVCSAVQFAHQNLVLHRDLKPGNILVDQDGQPKLLDFGIAKLIDGDATGAQTGTAHRIFTPDYAAPEQITGSTVTTTADIYALGVILFELLTGQRPFKRGGQALALRQVITDTAAEAPSRLLARQPDAHRQAAAVRGDLDTIALKCLDRDPQRRYATVAALQNDIERHLTGLPIEARPDAVVYRLGKFVRRHRVGSALAVAAVLGLLLTTSISLQQARRADAAVVLAQAERDTARAEARHQEALNEHFGAVLNRAVASGDQVEVAQLMKWAADPHLLGEFGDARMQRTITIAVSDLMMQNNDFPAALKLLDTLAADLDDASPRDRMLVLGNRAYSQLRAGALDDADRSLTAAEALLPANSHDYATAMLRSYRSQWLRLRGQFAESEQAALEAADWAATSNDSSPLSRGKIVGGMANGLLQMGNLDAAIAQADRALQIWRDGKVSRNAAMPSVASVAANARFVRGDIAAALAQLDELATNSGADESIPAQAARDGSRAKAMGLLNRREAALALAERAASAMCDSVGPSSHDCLRMRLSQVDTARIVGDLDTATRVLDHVQQKLDVQTDAQLQAIVTRFRQTLAVQIDPQPQALQSLLATLAAGGQVGIAQRNAVRALLVLAEQLDARGHRDAAIVCAEAAIKVAEGINEQGGMDQSLLALWRARLRDKPAAAADLEALSIAIGSDHPWVAAHRSR